MPPAFLGLVPIINGAFGHSSSVTRRFNRRCPILLTLACIWRRATSVGALTSAAVALRMTAIEAHRSSADLGARNRDTGTCAVLCRREAVRGSDTPRNGGRLVAWLGPCDISKTGQFRLSVRSRTQNEPIFLRLCGTLWKGRFQIRPLLISKLGH
jgi:hypothetical protein